MTDPTTIPCPVCDAPNAPRSLFCAECGTPLQAPDDESGGTDSGNPVTDSQSTAVIPSSHSWSEAAAAPVTRDTPGDSRIAPLPVSPVDEVNPYLAHPSRAAESRRGFWLGVVALILMLAILGMWIWGGVLAEDTRTSIQDLFR